MLIDLSFSTKSYLAQITETLASSSKFPGFRERVLQLENELATTQKYAGIPVQLPYEKPLLNGQLSPPELLKQPPVRNSKPHF